MTAEEQTKPTEADLLETAVDVLETGGWVRNHYQQDGSHCAVGALREATSRLYLKSPAATHWSALASRSMRRLSEVLIDRWGATKYSSPRDTVIIWNDDAAKDQYEVIDAMKLAAKRATGEI